MLIDVLVILDGDFGYILDLYQIRSLALCILLFFSLLSEMCVGWYPTLCS